MTTISARTALDQELISECVRPDVIFKWQDGDTEFVSLVVQGDDCVLTLSDGFLQVPMKYVFYTIEDNYIFIVTINPIEYWSRK